MTSMRKLGVLFALACAASFVLPAADAHWVNGWSAANPTHDHTMIAGDTTTAVSENGSSSSRTGYRPSRAVAGTTLSLRNNTPANCNTEGAVAPAHVNAVVQYKAQ